MLIDDGASERLFCYGTLEFPEVMRAVTGRDYPRRDAVLKGYARYRIRGEQFPGVVAERGAEVRGILYEAVDETALHLIDVYEDDCYHRRLLDVAPATGEGLRAWVYVVPAAARARLTDSDWDRAGFVRRHLDAWLRALGA